MQSRSSTALRRSKRLELGAVRRIACVVLPLAALLVLTACGGSASNTTHNPGGGSASDSTKDVVIVFSSDSGNWTRLDGVTDSHGFPLTRLDGSNLLGGSINPGGTLLIAADPSESHANPVLDVNMAGNGNVVYGHIPSWNESGSLGALNGAEGSLQFIDKRGAASFDHQPQPGTIEGSVSGESQPFSFSNLEFDGWIADDALLVHGDEGTLAYGPYVANLEDGKLNLRETDDLNPNEIFFNGHDGTYIQVDGTVGRLDVATGSLKSIGRVTPQPRASYTSIAVAWSPTNDSFVFDVSQNVVAGTTLCRVDAGVSCASVDTPGSERDGSTSYVWSRDGRRFIVNTLYLDDSIGSANTVVDAETRQTTPLGFHCQKCWVVGFMSRDGLSKDQNATPDYE